MMGNRVDRKCAKRGGIIQMRRMNAYSPRPAAALLVQSKTSVTDD